MNEQDIVKEVKEIAKEIPVNDILRGVFDGMQERIEALEKRNWDLQKENDDLMKEITLASKREADRVEAERWEEPRRGCCNDPYPNINHDGMGGMVCS